MNDLKRKIIDLLVKYEYIQNNQKVIDDENAVVLVIPSLAIVTIEDDYNIDVCFCIELLPDDSAVLMARFFTELSNVTIHVSGIYYIDKIKQEVLFGDEAMIRYSENINKSKELNKQNGMKEISKILH